MTEAQLINGCKANNVLAQKELYNKYAPKMMGVCFRYMHTREKAQDVLQEGMLKVFRNIEKYSGSGSLEGWIRRVIVNTCLEEIRKKKIEFNDELADNHSITSTNVMDDLNVKDLMRVIGKLPDGFRIVFNMYAIEGFNHREIAQELGISEGTSKSQLSRARKLLQEMITQENQIEYGRE